MAKHPVPKKRTSRSSRDARRSHHALKPPTLVRDPESGHMIPPHTVNPYTGRYKGRQVVEVDD